MGYTGAQIQVYPHWGTQVCRYRGAHFYALRSVRKKSTDPSNYDKVDVKSAQLGQLGMLVYQIVPLVDEGKKLEKIVKINKIALNLSVIGHESSCR